jgi:hypothetical protein
MLLTTLNWLQNDLYINLHFRISVENAFLDEKEDACCALGELAGNAG